MALRDDIDAEVTAKGRARVRATAIRDAIRDGSKTLTRGRWSLVISHFDVVRDGVGRVVGVEVFVRAYRDGVEVKIDNHRRILNPPVMVPDGTTRNEVVNGETVQVPNYVENVREALLTALMESITDHPNRAGWVAP